MSISVAVAAQTQDQPGLDAPAEDVADSARSMLEGFLETLPRLGIALLVVILAWIVSRLVRMILFRTLEGRQTPSFRRVMSKLAGWIVFLLGVLIATAVAFPSVKPVDLLAGLGIFSVAVGFAFQVVIDALAAVVGVRTEPAPEALVTQLGVSTVDIDARFWTDSPQHNARLIQDEAIRAVKAALDDKSIEMPADIIALQATPSFKAALQNEADVTPAGGVLAG